MKRLLIYFLLLLFVSSCDNVPSQDFYTKKPIDDSSAVSDSLLFLEYSERLNYHFGIRSDSVSWYIDELIKLSERNNKQLEVIRLLTNKATELMNSGDYSEALEYYTRAFEMAQNPETENSYWTLGTDATPEKRRLKILSFLHFNYGHLMDLTENNEESLNQYRIANQIAVENDDPIIESYTSTALAIAYLENNKIDSAQVYNRRSIRLSGQLPTQFYTSFAMWVQGNIHMTLEEYNDAYRSYSAGKESAQNENNYQGLLINFLGLSRYFYQINEPDSSLHYAYRTIGDGTIPDYQALGFDIGVAYENLYQVYKLRDETINALNYLELAKSTRDSLNERRIENLALFQQNLLNQQLEQKERERQFESIQARNRIIAVLVLLLVVVAITLVLYRNYKIKKEANQRLDDTNALLTDSLEKLTSAQDQLVQQEKLASLGQLTAGIAHEIKNPLNFVNNFSEVSLELVEEIREEVKTQKEKSPLSRGESEGEAGARGVSEKAWQTDSSQDSVVDSSLDTEFLLEILNDIEANLKTIHKHGSRADSIVKSMLQHSRGGDGKMEPTQLNPLIKEYVNLAFHGMRAADDPFNVDIDLQLDESVGEVPLVAEDFSRVILNLTNNAFDAMREKALTPNPSPGGEGRRGEGEYSPKLTVRTKSSVNTVTMEIEDNGPGISKDLKDKILQPFFTTKKGTAGTGLGLSITNDIIKAHGGTLDIESVPGELTRFKIKISKNYPQ